jgi:hypothetical protein
VAAAYLFHGPLGAPLSEALSFFSDGLLKGHSVPGHLFVCEAEKSIGIDQIRQVQEWVKYGPSQAPYLIVQVPNCDLLTTDAANAFLKTLEEPLPGVVFLLSSHHLFRVLPTIRSRCQLLDFPRTQEGEETPEGLLSYPDLLAMSPLDRLTLSESLAQDKVKLDAQLRFWLKGCEADFEVTKMMIEIMLHLQYNLNQRLQLDALLTRLP